MRLMGGAITPPSRMAIHKSSAKTSLLEYGGNSSSLKHVLACKSDDTPHAQSHETATQVQTATPSNHPAQETRVTCGSLVASNTRII